jgi:hypothetical protein
MADANPNQAFENYAKEYSLRIGPASMPSCMS